MKKISNKKWYPYTIALVVAVVLYVVLTHLGAINSGIGTFIGYFEVVIYGFIMAYLMNPLVLFYERKVFAKYQNKTLRQAFAVTLTCITVILLLVFLVGILVPQLVKSIEMLIHNMNDYLTSLQVLMDGLGISSILGLDNIMGELMKLNDKLASWLVDNASNILSATASAGAFVANLAIAFLLSIYILMSKDGMKSAMVRLLKALIPAKSYDKSITFIKRVDRILVQYIVFTLLDAVIVGVANAIFMTALGMDYVGLISLIVAVTNLVPTFGPIAGAALGGFILLLVNPVHALIFVLFALVLQTLDSYVIKPKLFGGSLGVSGLLITAAILVFGSMFGVVGMLIAIPLSAILDFVVREELVPALERRRKRIDARKDEENG